MAQRNRIFLALADRQYLFVGSVLFCVVFFFFLLGVKYLNPFELPPCI